MESARTYTTRYFPEISFGVGSLVIKLNVPISRAARGLNRLTSRVVTFGLLTCSAMPFHIAPIAALPFTMAEPGGNAIASTANFVTPHNATEVKQSERGDAFVLATDRPWTLSNAKRPHPALKRFL